MPILALIVPNLGFGLELNPIELFMPILVLNFDIGFTNLT
jgi:hypothetical protein